ncbi:MAG: DNA modification methylase [Candidatus Doudnabacteria bacterium]|nr:DNA modification methylase [Desulfobacterales bacterium]MDZ4244227.1 DNA modification methylase [Candidatus Doudnabacteria bacterium]
MEVSIKTVKLSAIKLNPDNPRRISTQDMERLVKSLQDFPDMMQIREVVVDENNVVLGGNMRLLALRKIGAKECTAKIVKGLTEAQKREFVIKDNSNFGAYDWDILKNDWDDLPLDDWGVELPDDWLNEPDAPKDAEPQIDKAAELNKTWKVKAGDLFQIGNHRLLCGDSTKAEDVARVMGGEKAELLFTSPPYSDMREYSGNDLSQLYRFISVFAPHAIYQAVNLGIKRKDDEVIPYWDEYLTEAKRAGLKLLSWNVWDKMLAGSISNQSAMFAIEHEWIFVFGETPKAINRTVEKTPDSDKRRKRDRVDARGKSVRAVRQADGTMHDSIKGANYTYKNLPTVIQLVPEMARDATSTHPAVFPIALPSVYIEAMTNVGDCVADPFLGSGTTMVSAENLKRRCFGIEISENYCAVILQRMTDAFPDIEIKKIER